MRSPAERMMIFSVGSSSQADACRLKRSTKQSGGKSWPKQKSRTSSEEAGLDKKNGLEKDGADKEPDEDSESSHSDKEPPQPTKECSEAGVLEVEPELLDLLTASTPSCLGGRLDFPEEGSYRVTLQVHILGKPCPC